MNTQRLPALALLLHVLLGACIPLRAGLVEKWTFDYVPSAADGTVIAGTVSTGENGRIATIRGAGAVSTSVGISLPGGLATTQAYIDLPNGLISPLTDLTVEVWLSLDTLQNWQRVFAFGSSSAGEITGPGGSFSGVSGIGLLPNRGINANQNRMYFERSGSIVNFVDTAAGVSLGNRHLFTYVWDDQTVPPALPSAVQRWYLDGVLVGQSAPFVGTLSQINDVNNWLGRSSFSADRNTDGTYDECAIYDHAMGAAEIQARFAAGPVPSKPPVYEKVFDFTDARAEDIANDPNKGAYPQAGLVQGSDGNFYGTTKEIPGSPNKFGTVFKMTPAGVLTTLVEFTGTSGSNKGSQPTAGLVQGSDGNFYGTTQSGALGYGTVFKVTPEGVLTTLVEFNGINGIYPQAGLVQGIGGDFYGTTSAGGANNNGTVFKVTLAGVLTTLVDFTGTSGSKKGSLPTAGLVQGSDGNFYGTTSAGGANDVGTVFKVTPGGPLTTLVDFTGDGTSNKGANPQAGLVQGSDGNFYGTTYNGGAINPQISHL